MGKALTIDQAHRSLKDILGARKSLTSHEILESILLVAIDVPKDAVDANAESTRAVQSVRTLLIEGANEKDDPEHLVDCIESYLAGTPAADKTPAPAKANPKADVAEKVGTPDRAAPRPTGARKTLFRVTHQGFSGGRMVKMEQLVEAWSREEALAVYHEYQEARAVYPNLWQPTRLDQVAEVSARPALLNDQTLAG